VVGSGEYDLDASADAFSLLDQVVGARLRRGLAVVVDTLGLDPDLRTRWRELGRAAGMPCVAVVLDTPAALCRERNSRSDRPVPTRVLDQQTARMDHVRRTVESEGWDRVLVVRDDASAGPGRPQPPTADAADRTSAGPVSSRATTAASGAARNAAAAALGLDVVLQVSRFPWGEDPAGWLSEVARAADAAGFAGVALMDHLIQIPQVGRSWEPIPEPWVTLGLLAGLDTRLRLGTLVSPVTFRPAGIIAKTVATLDVLTGGRAFVGLGAGWWEREHLAFGLPFPPPQERLDRLESAIETMRALWGAGTKAYDGERVRLPETTAYPRPVGQPQVLVGGSGEQRTLRIAAALADACNLPSDTAVLERKIAVLRQHCVAVGRPPEEVAITVLDLPVVGQDRDDTWRRVERLRGRAAAAGFARRHHAGETAMHRDRYRALADRGVSTVFVGLPDLQGPADIERFAPVLAGG